MVHCFSNSNKFLSRVNNGKQLETCTTHLKQKTRTKLAYTKRALGTTVAARHFKCAVQRERRSKRAYKYTQESVNKYHNSSFVMCQKWALFVSAAVAASEVTFVHSLIVSLISTCSGETTLRKKWRFVDAMTFRAHPSRHLATDNKTRYSFVALRTAKRRMLYWVTRR